MWYRSIGIKLIALVGIVAFLVIGVFSYASLTAQRGQLEMEMIRNVNLISEVILRSLRSDMLEYHPGRLHKAIDTIGAQEGIRKVRIFNALGEIIYSSDKAEMGTMLNKSAEQCYACHAREKPFERLATSARTRTFSSPSGHRLLGMINPIYNEPDCFSARCHVHSPNLKVLGVLDIDVGLGEVDQLIRSSKQQVILFAVVAICVISGIIAVLIQRFVNRPVRSLVEGTRRVTGGDLETLISLGSRDEIGILADSFNQMTLRLKASEKDLRESEQTYRSLFDNDPNPIFVIDVETFRIVDMNIQAVGTYGYSREEFLGMSFTDLGEPGEVERLRTLAVKGCVFFPRIRHRKRDGSPLYVNIHSCPRLHIGKDVIIANIANVTDRIQVEAQLIQAAKMATLGEMSAGVAHELNQPLNAIRIGCDFFLKCLAKERPIPPETLDRVSRQIISQVERAADIINHLREFGRKSQAEEMEALDINQPIRNVFTVLGQQLKLRQIEVKLELEDDLPPVWGVQNRLEQVFLNLVMNAQDAIEEKRRLSHGDSGQDSLSIRSFLEGGKVVVTVLDTGCGIPETIRDRIVEPFFTTKEVGRGTGLGLSISYGIVKDFGGQIEIISEEGAGALFKLSFPIADHREATHAEKVAAVRPRARA
jgi:PAS domain S-box-containing protein